MGLSEEKIEIYKKEKSEREREKVEKKEEGDKERETSVLYRDILNVKFFPLDKSYSYGLYIARGFFGLLFLRVSSVEFRSRCCNCVLACFVKVSLAQSLRCGSE